MPLKLDLHKSADSLRLSLEKAGIATPPPVEVCFDLDVSGSYRNEHADGTTTLLMTRLVPWGLVFDPDKKLDVFTFSDGKRHVHYVGNVNASNYEDYVKKNVIGKVPGYNGDTDYHYVLKQNLEHFGWNGSTAKKGFWKTILGGGEKSSLSTKRKSLVLFNTDGVNDDHNETDELFAEMERERLGMYVMFLGVSEERDTFRFIKYLADKYSNCGLTVIPDVRKWIQRSDEQINNELITPELVTWLKQ